MPIPAISSFKHR
uniref:Uncharacterized protein n=1 Tax=Anguilla anguilla TaxID=7936 RepID=A0A0E9U2B2_ANGAN